jgi:hypothetical protein
MIDHPGDTQGNTIQIAKSLMKDFLRSGMPTSAIVAIPDYLQTVDRTLSPNQAT